MRHLTTTFLISTLTLTAGFVSNSVMADQVDIDRVESAAATLDVEGLKAALNDLQGYDLAFGQYRTALSLNLLGQSDSADKHLDKAIEVLLPLEQEQPDNAEIKALLAQVYGYKIAISPIKGIVYGSKAQEKLQQAEKLAPNNPRVLLVKGISAVNTPPMFGGSQEVAMESFTKALVAYEGDEYSNYHWGYSETYTWKGMLLQQQGKQEQAQNEWKKALELTPNYGWAKSLLAKTNG